MKRTIARCPQCGKALEYSLDNPSRPFCSSRCKLIDLGAWAEERYAIGGPTALSEESGTEPVAEAPIGRAGPMQEK